MKENSSRSSDAGAADEAMTLTIAEHVSTRSPLLHANYAIYLKLLDDVAVIRRPSEETLELVWCHCVAGLLEHGLKIKSA